MGASPWSRAEEMQITRKIPCISSHPGVWFRKFYRNNQAIKLLEHYPNCRGISEGVTVC
jgi:hypothetical protein